MGNGGMLRCGDYCVLALEGLFSNWSSRSTSQHSLCHIVWFGPDFELPSGVSIHFQDDAQVDTARPACSHTIRLGGLRRSYGRSRNELCWAVTHMFCVLRK